MRISILNKDPPVDPYIARQVNMVRKYREGRDVDDGDLPFLKEMCSIGLMNTGVSLKRRVITAKPTLLGVKIMDGFGDRVPYVEPNNRRLPHLPLIEQDDMIIVAEDVTAPEKEVKPVEPTKHISRFEDIIE